MGLFAVSQETAGEITALVTPNAGIPRQLLSQIEAIAQPIAIISPRAAFSDSARLTAAVDGGPVQTMRDMSGNGYNASQSTTADQPVFRATGISESLPGLDFNSSQLKQDMLVSSIFANPAFSAGYTIYAVATSTGPQNISAAQTSGLSVLLSPSNGDYLCLQFGNSNAFSGKFNGGATIIEMDIGGGATPGVNGPDYNGVYVMAYDGVTGVIGLNGRYKTSAIAGVVPTSGDLRIGDLNAGGAFNWCTGLVSDVWVFAGRHTAAKMDAIGALLAADSRLLIPGDIFVGDSLTQGYGLTQPLTQNYAYQLEQALGANLSNPLVGIQSGGAYGNVFYENVGIDGETIANNSGSGMILDAQNTPWFRTGIISGVRGSQNKAFIWAGTNDMSVTGLGVSGAAAFASLKQLVALYRSANCKVFVGTCISRNPANAGAGFEAQRQIFNGLIRAAGTSLYDGLMDFAADPAFSSATAYTNTTYYQADGIHTTEQGAAREAYIAEQSVALVFGSGFIGPAVSPQSMPNTAPQTLAGTTAGTVTWAQPRQKQTDKEFVAYFSGYENNSAVNQTILFPTPFINAPSVVDNDSGLVITCTTTTLTITAPNNTTTFTGNVFVKGF